MAAKPTVLFVHGSWHTPKHFQPVRDLFHSNGYETTCPLLPTVGKFPPIGLMEDAQCIKSELGRLIEVESKDVLVIGHSYGGVVVTQATEKEFGKAFREKEGKKGGVIRILYMCAFVIPVGQSLGEALGGGPAPNTKLPPFIPTDEDGMCIMLDPQHRFYHDLPKEQQEHWVSEMIKCPATAQLTPLTYAGYLYHPVTYLFCEDDQALPLQLQQILVKSVEDSTGITIDKETCSASHSPFLSQPETLLTLVDKLVTKRQ